MRSHAADEQLADGGSRKHAVGDGRRKKKVGEGGKRVTEIEQETHMHQRISVNLKKERKNEANARVALDTTGTGVFCS